MTTSEIKPRPHINQDDQRKQRSTIVLEWGTGKISEAQAVEELLRLKI